jgi:small neutral amino acid transporter SnatA (MarC family)
MIDAGGIASGAGGGLGPSAAAVMVSAHDYSGVLLVGLVAYGFCALAILVAAYLLRTIGQGRQAGVQA